MNQLYKRLFLYFMLEGFSKAHKKSKSAYDLQKHNLNEILTQIAKISLRYTIKNDYLNLNRRQLKYESSKVSKHVISLMKNETALEQELTESVLTETVKNRYLQQSYLYNIGLNWNISILSDEKTDEIVNKAFMDKTWSRRISENKLTTASDLNREIKKFLKGYTTPQDIKKVIKNKYGYNAYETHRLVDTEVSRCMNDTCELFAHEHGIEYQLYSATLDRRTCEICKADDGKVFHIDDPFKPVLPRHPLDRCCYIDRPSEDWRPKMRKDNVTKKYVPYQNYNSWRKKYVKE